VFGMGRIWDEAKNTALLIEVAPSIQAPVCIAGDNRFEQNKVAVTGNINFLGKLSTTEVAEQLAIASVYVLPAKYEPFGLSALEAALSGCALVLGDIPSLREVWEDAALYCNTDDAQSLAQTVNELLANESMRTEYSQKAKQKTQQYTTEAMADNYWQLYQQTIKQTVLRQTQEIR
ncbi:MAG TPA: glycosyltransferase family 4 protein, partial [Flavisolibacter sp.]|nr:glycosyltransferase family 4 protein [Flavisolibacter sp.]